MEPTYKTPPNLRKGALAAVAVGAVGSAIGAMSDKTLFMSSYLTGWLFVAGVVLGSQALIYLHNLTGGQWGRAIYAPTRAAASLLPLVGLAFIPIALDLPRLYEWAHYEHLPESQQTDHILNIKRLYLNEKWFYIRAAGYFALWIIAAALVRGLERRRSRLDTFDSARQVRVGSAAAIGLYGLSMTFASIDWAMSLEPHWYSAAYGVIWVIGQALAAFAFNTSFVARMSVLNPDAHHDHHHEHPHGPSGNVHVHGALPIQDLGNLMLAFTMLWAYTSFSQFLIIWFGDLPEENVWYLRRFEHGWQILALMLVLLQYAVPFLALMSRHNKRTPAIVGKIAMGILAMRLVDITWQVQPAIQLHPHEYQPLSLGVVGVTLSTAMLLGGLALFLFDVQMNRPAYAALAAPEPKRGGH